ncbi:glycerophosphodiester phosphodiesterase [Priestia taiwanensis]|nr:glycerophosphodiester phosphodiesterase [Priestia taiwanensis]
MASGCGTKEQAVAKTEKAKSAEIKTDVSEVLNISHRGASGHAPEHTILAYQLGEDMQGDYIEIDLQMTKDGELVALHDETLERTTNGTGLVKDYTLAEIKKLDAGSWFNEKYPDKAKKEYVGLTVPTFDEVIEKFGKDNKYYIETKSPEVYPGMEEKLLEKLHKHGLVGKDKEASNAIVQSFSPESLKKMHELDKNVPLVQLLWYEDESKLATITDEELKKYKEYTIGVGMNFAPIDKTYVQKVREHDLEIHPYTVNEKEDMKKLLEWGVTGMFTNFPDRLEEILEESSKK